MGSFRRAAIVQLLAMTCLGALLGAVWAAYQALVIDDLGQGPLMLLLRNGRLPVNQGAVAMLALGLLGWGAHRLVAQRQGRGSGGGRPARGLALPGLLALGTITLVTLNAGPYLAPRPNVVLIVVDTLRADHLGIYGYQRDTSPNLDALARESFLYRNAVSTAPWTSPAVGSLLTGRYPPQIGITGRPIVLDEAVRRLPEVLQARGYETAGIVSHLYVGRKYNYQQGFGFWDESQAKGHTHVSSHEVTNRAIEFLRRSGERRFFLFLHYFDPHLDYMQHEKYDYSAGYSGPVRSGNDNTHELRKLAWSGRLKRRDIRYLRALYDSEISYTDEHIGRFLDELKRRGLYDHALIIVTSDHGESIVDRPDRWIGHTIGLFGEYLNVPLILKLPGRRGHRLIEEWVSIIDIPATILSLTGPAKPRGMPLEGRPLTRPRAGRALFAQTRRTFAKDTVVMNGWKLIHSVKAQEHELFDLTDDPGERRDLVAAEPRVASALSGLLREWREQMEAATANVGVKEPAYTPEEIDMLRGLGYTH
jgi:arylsulfatase A-like enzyme